MNWKSNRIYIWTYYNMDINWTYTHVHNHTTIIHPFDCQFTWLIKRPVRISLCYKGVVETLAVHCRLTLGSKRAREPKHIFPSHKPATNKTEKCAWYHHFYDMVILSYKVLCKKLNIYFDCSRLSHCKA